MQQAAAEPLWKRPEDWGEVAVGVLAVGAVVVGGPVGLGIAVGMGASAFAQWATTGEVDMDDVAIAGVAGMIGAGVGVRVGRIVKLPTTSPWPTVAVPSPSPDPLWGHGLGRRSRRRHLPGGDRRDAEAAFRLGCHLRGMAGGYQFKTLGAPLRWPRGWPARPWPR